MQYERRWRCVKRRPALGHQANASPRWRDGRHFGDKGAVRTQVTLQLSPPQSVRTYWCPWSAQVGTAERLCNVSAKPAVGTSRDKRHDTGPRYAPPKN